MLTVVGAKRDIWFGLSPNRKWYRQCFSAALETLTKPFNVLCHTCANYGWLFKSNLEEPLYLLKRCTRPLTFAVTNNGLVGSGKSEVTLPKLPPRGFSPGESGPLPPPQYIIHTPPSTLSQNCQNPFLSTSPTKQRTQRPEIKVKDSIAWVRCASGNVLQILVTRRCHQL